MSVQDNLMPGEQILSECKPFYATSRRIIRYDERAARQPMAEVAYQQLASVELMRTPSHPVMVMGTIIFLVAVFLTFSGIIVITSIPAMLAGAALLALGAKGKFGYYQLHFHSTRSAMEYEARPEWWGSSLRNLMENMGLSTPKEKALWQLDYATAGSFIATGEEHCGGAT